MGVQVFQGLIEAVAERLKQADVFEDVQCNQDVLCCQARDVESEACYQLLPDTDDPAKVWAGLYTADRWLSESIEADLLHSGDKMEDLLDEELVELGFDKGPLPIEHFRDDAKQYVFRTSLSISSGDRPEQADIDHVVTVMLAYEACFRQLGDMDESEDL